MKVVDLFAGAGGFSTAALQAGLDVIFAANHWKLAVTVHQANHPTVPMAPMKLMTDTDWTQIPKMDLLIASPACVPSDAMIEMADGSSRRVDSLTVGDEVLTHEGRGRPVKNIWKKKFTGRMVSLRVSGDTTESVRMTDDHRVLIRRRGGKHFAFGEARWVTAGEIKNGDYVSFPRLIGVDGTAQRFVEDLVPAAVEYEVPSHAVVRNKTHFDRSGHIALRSGSRTHVQINPTDPELWWLIGHYIGDGEARKQKSENEEHTRAELGWSTGGCKENLLRVRRILESFGLSSWTRDKRGNNRVFCSSAHLYAICVAFGRLCHLKRIPAELHQLEERFVRAMIEGYLDADGSEKFYHGKTLFSATSTSLGLLKDLQRMCWRLGWAATISVGDYARERTIEGRPVFCRASWQIQIRKEPHKQSQTKFDMDPNTLWRSVKAVETKRVTRTTVYDIEVEEDHTFCLPGVVVHNCQGFSTAATRYGGGKRGGAPKHDDDRVTSMAVIECVDRHRPKAVIIENVAEILEWGLYPWWKEGFARMGYSVSENVLNAADTGVPQERERVFIVAVKGKKKVVVPPGRKEHVGILGSLDLDAGDWDFVSNKPHGVQARVARARAGKFKTAPLFIVHDDSYHSGRAVTRPIGTITTKDQWRIVRRDKRGRDETRLLNVDEYRAAMGFPEDYLLPVGKNDSVRLLGNAVAPPMARYVIDRVVRAVG